MIVTPASLGSLAGASTSPAAGSSASAGDFAGALGAAIDKVNQLQANTEQKVNQLLAGTGQDVHEATLSMERTSLAFDLMLQVRNKVVGAYQEISKLQF